MKVILLLFLFLVSVHIHAQTECATTDRTKYQKANRKPAPESEQLFQVPVVFHVIYRTKAQNISDARINDVLTTLTADFVKSNADISDVPYDFKEKVGNPKVRFYLADKRPDGSSFSGVIRVKTTIKKFRVSKRAMFKKSPILNSRKYLNVYICNVNTNGFVPSEPDENVDAVVINWRRVKGGIRTLTHEVGHWFDLRHIFKGGCKNKDGVKDTPGQKKHSHVCKTHPHTDCDEPAMFMNFMDYSSCRNFFTRDQVFRMRNYILNYKDFE